MLLQLKRFEPESVADNAVCLFIGKRGTGKSTCLKDVLFHHRHVHAGVCMSGTEECNEFWKECVPDTFIFNDYEPKTTRKLIKRQRRARQEGRNPEPIFFIAEDVLYDKRLSHDANIRGVFMNGRHWNILFLVTMQYVLDIPPSMRSNVDFVFAFREHVLANKEKLWRAFYGIFPSYDMFDQVFNACTEGYECLVLDNTRKTNKIEECVFWYKADRREGFRVGSKEYWAFHVMNYNPGAGGGVSDDDSDEDMYPKQRKHTIKKLQ
jgi:hypothetical protein